MSAVDDFDQVIERYYLALGTKETYLNPLFPVGHGWDEVAERLERAASTLRDGENVGFEIVEKDVTPELAYLVRVERPKAKIGGREDTTPSAPRVTMIFRREDGTWKVAHRHADAIFTPQPAESVIQQGGYRQPQTFQANPTLWAKPLATNKS